MSDGLMMKQKVDWAAFFMELLLYLVWGIVLIPFGIYDWLKGAVRYFPTPRQYMRAIAVDAPQRGSQAEPQASVGRDPVEPAQRAECVEEKGR